MNPFKLADFTFKNIIPYIYHDFVPHDLYNRKKLLTDQNETEFLYLYNLSVRYDYPYIFTIIFFIFHELQHSYPFSIYIFMQWILIAFLKSPYINSVDIFYNIRDLPNDQHGYKFITFLYNSGFITDDDRVILNEHPIETRPVIIDQKRQTEIYKNIFNHIRTILSYNGFNIDDMPYVEQYIADKEQAL
jgi:hypothetical protein